MTKTTWSGGVALGVLGLLTGCADETCLGGDESCTIASPCEELEFTCEGGFTEAYVIGPEHPLPEGVTALAADGDLVLANDQIVVVIDALDHPHYIAPSGGGILDMARRESNTDGLRHVLQAAGLLPGESALYDHLEIVEDGDVKAVQAMGALDYNPEDKIVTRYEIRPCEPGLRVRTELLNGGTDPESWVLADGWYLGDRQGLPFFPTKGRGFFSPSFGLSTVSDVVTSAPFLVIGARPSPAANYGTVSCSEPDTTGFTSKEVSAVGLGPSIVMPRDWRVSERFITVSDGPSTSAVIDTLLGVREQLFDEPWATVRGQIEAPVGPSMVATGMRVDVTISEGSASDPAEERTPWTHIRPGPDGAFEARVPADRDYVISVDAYGRTVVEVDLAVDQDEVDAGTITLPAVGELTIQATVDGDEDHVLVFVVPADDATHEATVGRALGNLETCAPLLGHPHGDSPACNRVLVSGPTTVSVPPGTYDLFAAAGPFSTLARLTDVTVVAGEGESVEIDIERLPLQPEGTLSGDYHVHGGPSFDATINDHDRVRAFLASGIEVIATTEHDVVYDYAEAIADLDAADRLRVMIGTESTGHILWNYIPADTNPAVVGHWNFWPITYDPRGPWRGAAWDEKAEPGTLMQRMADDAGWDAETGVAQLNHPLSGLQLGRAFGWADSLGIDAHEPLRTEFDGTGQSIFLHTPEGSSFSNADYHVQEVMNGTANGEYLKYRAFWFYLLNQGIFRAGTGNSDSHSLTENVLGTPRTITWTDTTFEAFDPVAFNADLKAGRSLMTNGPIVEIATTDAASATRTPSMEVFAPGAGASLAIRVAAAPWMPIEEVRVIVNGEVAQTIPVTDPADPASTDPDDFERLDTTIPLADLLPDSGDAWLVVEAGPPHRLVDDLDCNGFPDTTDNNDDGTVDWRDVADLAEEPEESCYDTVGPVGPPALPADREDPRYWFGQVFPGGYPLAVTNPLIFDVDGGGFQGVLQ